MELLRHKVTRLNEMVSTSESSFCKVTPSSRIMTSSRFAHDFSVSPISNIRNGNEIDSMIQHFKDKINTIISSHSYRPNNSPVQEKVTSFRLVTANNSPETKKDTKREESYDLDQIADDIMDCRLEQPERRTSNKLNFSDKSDKKPLIVPKIPLNTKDDSVELINPLMNPSRHSRNIAEQGILEKNSLYSLDSKPETNFKKEPSLGVFKSNVRKVKMMDSIRKDAANFSAERLEECKSMLDEFDDNSEEQVRRANFREDDESEVKNSSLEIRHKRVFKKESLFSSAEGNSDDHVESKIEISEDEKKENSIEQTEFKFESSRIDSTSPTEKKSSTFDLKSISDKPQEAIKLKTASRQDISEKSEEDAANSIESSNQSSLTEEEEELAKTARKVTFDEKPIIIKYNSSNNVKYFEVFGKNGKRMRITKNKDKKGKNQREAVLKVNPADQEKQSALNKLKDLIAQCEEEEEQTELPVKDPMRNIKMRNIQKIKEIERKVREGEEWRTIRKTRSVTPKPKPVCCKVKENPHRFFSKSPPRSLLRRINKEEMESFILNRLAKMFKLRRCQESRLRGVCDLN